MERAAYPKVLGGYQTLLRVGNGFGGLAWQRAVNAVDGLAK